MLTKKKYGTCMVTHTGQLGIWLYNLLPYFAAHYHAAAKYLIKPCDWQDISTCWLFEILGNLTKFQLFDLNQT